MKGGGMCMGGGKLCIIGGGIAIGGRLASGHTERTCQSGMQAYGREGPQQNIYQHIIHIISQEQCFNKNSTIFCRSLIMFIR